MEQKFLHGISPTTLKAKPQLVDTLCRAYQFHTYIQRPEDWCGFQ